MGQAEPSYRQFSSYPARSLDPVAVTMPDKALLLAADKVAEEIERVLDVGPVRRSEGRPIRSSGEGECHVEVA